jgi:uncharacterized protein YndB with AHSA1/START domain
LEVRRFIPASPEQVFDAWTTPSELKQWWGPKDVHCVAAEIDLRVGGSYRIANELPDKSIIWIDGEFEQIERPVLLIYSWRTDPKLPASEKVTVRFSRAPHGTEVAVTHERVATPALRDQHEQGWVGCLDGLSKYLEE